MTDLNNIRIDRADFAGIPQTGVTFGHDGHCPDGGASCGLCGSDGVVTVGSGADGGYSSCVSTRPVCPIAGEWRKGSALSDEHAGAIARSSAGLQKGDDGLSKRDHEDRWYGDNPWHRDVRLVEGGKVSKLSRSDRLDCFRAGRGIAGVLWSLFLFVILNGSVVNALANEELMPYVGNEQLYMVSGNSLFVFGSNGRMIRVGEVPALTAMASLRGNLYMIAADDAALHILDIETGTATRVGNVEGFGVSEYDPENLHLTAHNNRLYMTGSATEALYIVDAKTGEAERVDKNKDNPVERYGIADFFADAAFPLQGLTSYGGQLYVIGSDGALYLVDSGTGVSGRVGYSGISDLHGLASQEGGIFAVGRADSVFYTLDRGNARASRIGSADELGIASDIVSPVFSIHLYVPADQMDTSGGTLYMLAGRDIYAVNTKIGSATRIAIIDEFSGSPSGLTFHNGMFYAIIGGGLYTFNIEIGEKIERVGSAYDFDSNLVSHKGQLYAVVREGSCHPSPCLALYAVDAETGIKTSRIIEVERGVGFVSHDFDGDDDKDLILMGYGFIHVVDTDEGRIDRIVTSSIGNALSHNGMLYALGSSDDGASYSNAVFLVNEDLQTLDQRVGNLHNFGNLYNFGRFELISPNFLVGRPIPPLASAILPASRSIQVNQKATVFATVINGADTLREDCEIRINNAPDGLDFRYFQTDATNIVTSDENEVVDIPTGGHQSYLIEVTSQAAFSPTEIFPTFICRDQIPATTTSGVNSVVLSVSDAPTVDIIAIALTPSNDGTLRGTSRQPVAFALASFNEGVAGQVRVAARGTGAAAALSMSICQTNMMTGQCVAGVPEQQAIASLDARESLTWSVFVGSDGPVPHSPAESRIVIEFFDDGGVLRGATSVAVLME